jgi:hypothetical protein
MPIHCTKCGEELLGAVNRCWKCGQTYVPSQEPVDAVVVEPPAASDTAAGEPIAMPLEPVATPVYAQKRRATTAELIEARLAGQMAMGGTVASLVLGVFAAAMAFIWPLAALIAVIGLLMGIWGLQSPKRNLALVGMLLCCLSIGVGTFSAVHRVYLSYKQSQPIQMPYEPEPIDTEP